MRKNTAVLFCAFMCISIAILAFASDSFPNLTFNIQKQPRTSKRVIGYTASTDEAAKTLRSAMVNRAPTAVVKYKIKSSERPNEELIKEQIFDIACQHTGKPNEGDSLKWAWKTWDCDVSSRRNKDVYYFTFRYHINFYTTPEQEAEFLSAILDLKSILQLDGKTETEKVEAIYDYICEEVTYDYTNLSDNTYDLKFTDYAALINKTSLCQGYAVLFYRLALEYGIDARVISGKSFDEMHGWNIVRIGDLYYYVDATLDAEREPDEYYLKGSDTFLEDHFCDEDYSSSNFSSEYPISKMDFCEDY